MPWPSAQGSWLASATSGGLDEGPKSSQAVESIQGSALYPQTSPCRPHNGGGHSGAQNIIVHSEQSALSDVGGSQAEAEAADSDTTSEMEYEANVAQWRETEAMARDIQQVRDGDVIQGLGPRRIKGMTIFILLILGIMLGLHCGMCGIILRFSIRERPILWVLSHIQAGGSW